MRNYCICMPYPTVAFVMRKSDSWLTVSTSGELFMMVLTLVMGKETSAASTRRGGRARVHADRTETD